MAQQEALFAALGDEIRLQVLEALDRGPWALEALAESLGLAAEAVQAHLEVLAGCGLAARGPAGWALADGGRSAVKGLAQTLRPRRYTPPAEGESVLEKKKLYVLTGFLGSGKTTVLLHLLRGMEGKRIGIIQNEFGKLSIDGEILRRDGITMTEISRGSIFCSCLKLNFVQALAEMGQQDLEYVFVESSGLADPSNIEEILEAVKVLAGDVYELKGVLCLIDGEQFLEQLSDVATVDRQLAHCHLAIVNKADLIDEEQLGRVLEAIRGVNPRCAVQVCANGAVDFSFLEEDLMALQWAGCEDSLNSPDNKPKTLSLTAPGVVPKEKLEDFLQAVLPQCYRIKGFFLLEDGWNQVDVVGKRIDYKPAPEKEEPHLVFLSKVGIQVIRTIDQAWRERVGLPMKLHN